MRLQVGQELLQVNRHLCGDGGAILLHEGRQHLLLLARPSVEDGRDAGNLLGHTDGDVEALHLFAPVDSLVGAAGCRPLAELARPMVRTSKRSVPSSSRRSVCSRRRGRSAKHAAVRWKGRGRTTVQRRAGGRYQLKERVGGWGRRRAHRHFVLLGITQQCAALVSAGSTSARITRLLRLMTRVLGCGHAHIGASQRNHEVVCIFVVKRVRWVALIVDF